MPIAFLTHAVRHEPSPPLFSANTSL